MFHKELLDPAAAAAADQSTAETSTATTEALPRQNHLEQVTIQAPPKPPASSDGASHQPPTHTYENVVVQNRQGAAYENLTLDQSDRSAAKRYDSEEDDIV